MADPSRFECTVNNLAKNDLTLKDSGLDWGKWVSGPVDTIKAGKEEIVLCSSGRIVEPDTTGYVIYTLNDGSGTTVKISWDLPWVSVNTLKVEPSDDVISVTIEGWVGTGGSEAPTLTIHDDRNAA